jgi:hypothetical protein
VGTSVAGVSGGDVLGRSSRFCATSMKAMDLGNRAYRSSSLTVTVTRP